LLLFEIAASIRILAIAGTAAIQIILLLQLQVADPALKCVLQLRAFRINAYSPGTLGDGGSGQHGQERT
jgi:hypothetical protein